MEAMSKTVDNAAAQSGAAGPARMPATRQSSSWFLIEALGVVAILGAAAFMPGGMLTAHMAAHILAMSVAAPLCAWMLRRHLADSRFTGQLYAATGVQLAVFFLWHSPPAMALAMQSMTAHLLMLGVLFAVAVWFWSCVIRAVQSDRLDAIAVLLITGKLVCLIAALLVFAPRVLYAGGMVDAAIMGDQQLAGLVMLTACPLTYVGASILIVARWFTRLSSPPAERAI